ncbi:hypothetical protein [Streptomyces bacillaris]|uniref:hypothetical protein n=1 Tax=Streptomyces bacillaris TaxID=68179 RepID=UPI003628BC53
MPRHMGVCDPWPVELCCDLPEDLEQSVIDRWTLVASQILWGLSGRRWGPCPVTVRPCRRACAESSGPVSFQAGAVGPWVPYIGADGVWRNASLCGCGSDCSCGELCEVRLVGPVYDVVSVSVDGVTLLPEDGAYRVDDPGLLVRTDGECWPTCQDMAAPEGAEGTFAVTYRIGLPLDEAAVAAVSELTCHFIQGCSPGACGCRANRSVSRMTRQGVELQLPDPTLLYSEGRTGLPLADLWLATVNPYRLPDASRVYSPDYRRPRRTVWP